MLNRFLAVAALVTTAMASAQAGTLQNGVYTPNCTAPGDAPAFSSKSPEAYNKSAKAAQDWQATAKTYADCLNAEAKNDQQAIISTANDTVKKLSDQINALNADSAAAVEILKKKNGSH